MGFDLTGKSGHCRISIFLRLERVTSDGTVRWRTQRAQIADRVGDHRQTLVISVRPQVILQLSSSF